MATYGVGYNSKGKDKYPTSVKGKKVKCYKLWESMIQRCYDLTHKSYSTYGGAGVYVDTEWHDYQSFAKWAEGAKYFDGAQIDKDLLHISGPKVYSKNTCQFVSRKVNTAEAHAKSYTFITPQGIYIKAHNLTDFCIKNDLSRKCMVEVLAGRNKQHKGWTTSRGV